jgi:integrase/recombinase XerD
VGVFDRQGRRKYLNGAERQAFFEAIGTEQDKAQQTFALTLFYTGCRISEALNLTGAGVDLSQRSLVFETLKRRKRGVFRAVPIPDHLVKLLREQLTEAAPPDRVWPFSRATAYRLVKRCMAQGRICGAMASPKGLRHGFAVACVAQEIPLPTVKKWLGHARLETTAIYLEVLGDEERNLARRLWVRSTN